MAQTYPGLRRAPATQGSPYRGPYTSPNRGLNAPQTFGTDSIPANTNSPPHQGYQTPKAYTLPPGQLSGPWGPNGQYDYPSRYGTDSPADASSKGAMKALRWGIRAGRFAGRLHWATRALDLYELYSHLRPGFTLQTGWNVQCQGGDLSGHRAHAGEVKGVTYGGIGGDCGSHSTNAIRPLWSAPLSTSNRMNVWSQHVPITNPDFVICTGIYTRSGFVATPALYLGFLVPLGSDWWEAMLAATLARFPLTRPDIGSPRAPAIRPPMPKGLQRANPNLSPTERGNGGYKPPWPTPKVRFGPGRGFPRKPPKGTKEKKMNSLGAGLLRGVEAVTEGIDALKAVHGALPKSARTPNATPQQMASDIWNNVGKLDGARAVGNILMEGAIDQGIGRTLGAASKGARKGASNFMGSPQRSSQWGPAM